MTSSGNETFVYVFIDTETTGFATNGVQPRIVSMAWMIADNPTKPRVFKYTIVRPDGFSIPWQAARVHGISTEMALAKGKPISTVLSDFANDMMTLNPKAVVAHNSSYDLPIIAAEFQQLAGKNPCAKMEVVCTMMKARNRWPGQSAKLCDVYARIFSKPMENAHNASGDVWACAQVFFHLSQSGAASSR